MIRMPQSGLICIRGEQPEGDEAGGHEGLAVGEIHDAGDAVLQRETDRDERVGAAEQNAGDDGLH